MGLNFETTSGEAIPCPDLRLISGRNTLSMDFPIWKIFRINVRLIRLQMQCKQILPCVNRVEIKIYGLHRGSIKSGLRRGQGVFSPDVVSYRPQFSPSTHRTAVIRKDAAAPSAICRAAVA